MDLSEGTAAFSRSIKRREGDEFGEGGELTWRAANYRTKSGGNL